MTLPFVFISAWNDSGGGFLHRLFDGHPQIRCYPFEVQLGTDAARDGLADWFHPKYRWPVIREDASPEAIFDAVINDELWDAERGGANAKFKDFSLDLDVNGWRRTFIAELTTPATAGRVVRLYLDSFFEAWRDRRRGNAETIILGHCPVMVLDWDRIHCEIPSAKMLNVVRSPFTGFVDMRRRHPTLDPVSYGKKWALITTLAFVAAAKDADDFRVVLFDRLIDERAAEMADLAQWLGLKNDDILLQPCWNGAPIQLPGPFGGVPRIGREHENANLTELDGQTMNVLARATAGARALFNIPTP